MRFPESSRLWEYKTGLIYEIQAIKDTIIECLSVEVSPLMIDRCRIFCWMTVIVRGGVRWCDAPSFVAWPFLERAVTASV